MLKPQDLVVVTKIATIRSTDWTYARMGEQLKLAPSVIFDSLKRCARVGIYDSETRQVDRDRLRHFVLHCVEFLFPSEAPAADPLTASLPELAQVDPALRRLVTVTDALRARKSDSRDWIVRELQALYGD